jgi:hypothetical protein
MPRLYIPPSPDKPLIAIYQVFAEGIINGTQGIAGQARNDRVMNDRVMNGRIEFKSFP